MSRWIVRPLPRPRPTCRLVCIPHAGGGPSTFSAWPELLAPTIELCAIELPGHGADRDPALHDTRAIVAPLADALAPLLDVPVALFGHSMGALVAFELARELRRRGSTTLAWLFPSAYPAPQLPVRGPQTFDLPEAEFRAELDRWFPSSDAAEREMMAELVPMLRADFEVCDRYAYSDEPTLDVPISAFGGMSDREVTKPELEAWSAQTSREFRLRMMPGEHLYYRTDPTRLLRVVDKELRAIQG